MAERDTQGVSSEAQRRASRHARELVLALWTAIRVSRYHAMENDATRQAAARLHEKMSALFEVQYEVSILFYAKDFHVNEMRLKSDANTWEAFAGFADDLVAHQVGRLHYAQAPTMEQLAGFVAAYNKVEISEGSDPFAGLMTFVDEDLGVHIERFVTGEMTDLPVVDKQTFVRQSYFRAIHMVKQMYDEARTGRPLSLRLAKRAVQNFVDVVLDDDPSHSDLLFLLAGVKNWQGYFFNHTVNTCVYALGVGRELGLERQVLRDLGVGALLADLGNAMIPVEILDSGKPLSAEETAIVHGHPLRGVPAIVRFQEPDPVLIRAVVVSLFHHRAYDGRGYPSNLDRTGDFFAEIVAVCDRYDAMTTSRPHRKKPLTDPEAMKRLRAQSGKYLNPVAVSAFERFHRTLPPGRVVVLESGELAYMAEAPQTKSAPESKSAPKRSAPVRPAAVSEPMGFADAPQEATTFGMDETLDGAALADALNATMGAIAKPPADSGIERIPVSTDRPKSPRSAGGAVGRYGSSLPDPRRPDPRRPDSSGGSGRIQGRPPAAPRADNVYGNRRVALSASKKDKAGKDSDADESDESSPRKK